MPNLSYQRGANRERKIKADLEGEGYALVVRTAGSHSPVDVIAIKEMVVTPDFGLCFTGKLIQSKTSTKFKSIKKKEQTLETKNGTLIIERWSYPSTMRKKKCQPQKKKSIKKNITKITKKKS